MSQVPALLTLLLNYCFWEKGHILGAGAHARAPLFFSYPSLRGPYRTPKLAEAPAAHLCRSPLSTPPWAIESLF